MFYEVELVTREKNFCKNFRVSNSKVDVILRNSILELDFVTREFRTSKDIGEFVKINKIRKYIWKYHAKNRKSIKSFYFFLM